MEVGLSGFDVVDVDGDALVAVEDIEVVVVSLDHHRFERQKGPGGFVWKAGGVQLMHRPIEGAGPGAKDLGYAE